jgi:hypothetical protein
LTRDYFSVVALPLYAIRTKSQNAEPIFIRHFHQLPNGLLWLVRGLGGVPRSAEGRVKKQAKVTDFDGADLV